MKLVRREPESGALRASIAREEQAASVLAEIEVIRAARRREPGLVSDAEIVVSQVSLLEITAEIRARAARLDPAEVRSLDAIHLATALELGDEVDHFVTYDRRLADAAERAGLTVLAPK